MLSATLWLALPLLFHAHPDRRRRYLLDARIGISNGEAGVTVGVHLLPIRHIRPWDSIEVPMFNERYDRCGTRPSDETLSGLGSLDGDAIGAVACRRRAKSIILLPSS